MNILSSLISLHVHNRIWA